MTGGGATTGTGATTCGDTGPARVARVVSAWTREGASARWHVHVLVHVLDLVLVLVLVGPGPGRSWSWPVLAGQDSAGVFRAAVVLVLVVAGAAPHPRRRSPS